MESVMCSDNTTEFGISTEPAYKNLEIDSSDFLRLLKIRQAILYVLCEEVRNGRLGLVNSLFGSYGFSVNPEFLETLSGRLNIMRDIEIALNEVGDESFLAEFSAIEAQMLVNS